MECDTASEDRQGIEETPPPNDIIESSKLKLSSDLEKSLKFTNFMGVPRSGMVGADFKLKFYPSSIPDIFCHRFMLAARSEVFHSIFMETPLKQDWKIENSSEVAVKNMMKYIYTGTIDDVPIDKVPDHLRLVTMIKLEPMGQLVQRRIIDVMNDSNCIKCLNISLSNPFLLQLKGKAIRTIVDNLSSLVSLEEWEDLVRSQPSLTTEILRIYFMR